MIQILSNNTTSEIGRVLAAVFLPPTTIKGIVKKGKETAKNRQTSTQNPHELERKTN